MAEELRVKEMGQQLRYFAAKLSFLIILFIGEFAALVGMSMTV